MGELKLTKEERRRILEGDYSALRREKDPGDVKGQVIPLLRDRPRTVPRYEEPKFSGHRREIIGTDHAPEFVKFSIILAKKRRHKKGHWLVPFDVHDERPNSRDLAPSTGPKGSGTEKLTEESDLARGYGGGPYAVDRGAVDDDELKRQRVKAEERWAKHREEVASDEERRRQERAVRDALRQRLKGLDPLAQQALLAGVERLIREAGDEAKEAA